MPRSSLLLLLMLSNALPGLAHAVCGAGGLPLTEVYGSPFLSMMPARPTSTSVISVDAGLANFTPLGVTVRVDGGTIIVSLQVMPSGLSPVPPLACSTTTFGPLPGGHYTIEYHAIDPQITDPVPGLVGTGALEVAAASVPAPSLSTPMTMLLGVSVLLVGLWAARQRERATPDSIDIPSATQ